MKKRTNNWRSSFKTMNLKTKKRYWERKQRGRNKELWNLPGRGKLRWTMHGMISKPRIKKLTRKRRVVREGPEHQFPWVQPKREKRWKKDKSQNHYQNLSTQSLSLNFLRAMPQSMIPSMSSILIPRKSIKGIRKRKRTNTSTGIESLLMREREFPSNLPNLRRRKSLRIKTTMTMMRNFSSTCSDLIPNRPQYLPFL